MSHHTQGPWELDSMFPDEDGYKIRRPGGGLLIAVVKNQGSAPVYEAHGNKGIILAAPDLFEEVRSTDQGYDWFRTELETFIIYQGGWTADFTEKWAASLLAHVNSRQIGTRAAIARAGGR